MTRFSFIAVLLAAGLMLSLSVYGLADGEESAGTAVDETDVGEIHAQIEGALKAVPWEEIGRQLADVQSSLDGIDPDAIRAEVEAAMAGLDIERIHADARAALEDVDWDAIQRDIEAAHAEIETMDLEDVRADVLEAMEEIDWDEIHRTLEQAKGLAAEELEALNELLEAFETGSSGVI